MRIDKWLVESGHVESREKAQEMLQAGWVQVNGRPVTKPAYPINPNDQVELSGSLRYVGRGGLKLQAAIERWQPDLQGCTCADVGASTGGFTDCLLQHGAAKVYAIDVGSGQMHPSLRNDPRVVLMENVNARYLEKLPEQVRFVVMDVSFIPAGLVLPQVQKWLAHDGELFLLLKPQFEAPNLTKRGVIKDGAVRETILRSAVDGYEQNGWQVLDEFLCPVAGDKGNREYWLRLRSTIEGIARHASNP